MGAKPSFATGAFCSMIFNRENSAEYKSQRAMSMQERLQTHIDYLSSLPSFNAVDKRKFMDALADMNKMGELQKLMNTRFSPHLKTQHYLTEISRKPESANRNTLAELLRETFRHYNASQPPTDSVQILSIIQTLRNLQTIDSLTPGKQNKQDKDLDPKEANQNKEKNDDNSKEDSQQEASQDPNHQKDYQVHNKDLKSSSGKSKKPQYLIGTTAPVPMSFLRTNIHEQLGSPLQKNAAARRLKKAKNHTSDIKGTETAFYLNPSSLSQFVIGKSYGFDPVVGNYGSYTVVEILPEEYVVKSNTSNPLPKMVLIQLAEEAPVQLSKSQLDFLTQKSSIEKGQWPDYILQGVERARVLGNGQLFQTAKILSEWVSHDGPNIYNSSEGKYADEYKKVNASLSKTPNALELARAKMFNCDGAALLVSTLLRDFFNIPVRIATGRTFSAQGKFNNEDQNLVDFNDPLHAWIEVYFNGKWVALDPTPTRNSPQGDSKGEAKKKPNDPIKKRPPVEDRDDKKSNDEKKSGSSQEQGSESSNKSKADASKENNSKTNAGGKSLEDTTEPSDRMLGDNIQNGEARPKESDKTTAGENGNNKEAKNKKQDNHSDSEGKSSISKQADGSIDNKSKNELDQKENKKEENNEVEGNKTRKSNIFNETKEESNTLWEALIKEALSYTLDQLVGKAKRTELGKILLDLKLETSRSRRLLESALGDLHRMKDIMFGIPDGTLTENLAQAKAKVYSAPESTYNTLQAILEFYRTLAKVRELTSEETKFVQELIHIKSEFQKYSDPNALAHTTLKNLMSQLPGGIIREHILESYPEAEKLGSPDQNRLFEDLLQGKLKGILQASLVNKHFDFFLATDKEFRYRFQKSLLRSDERKRNSEDIVIAGINDISRIDRWSLTDLIPDSDPTSSLFSRLVRDEQYMRWYRQMDKVSGVKNAIERSMTVIFYDISSSMRGTKASIQASAISAVVDKELSKTDDFGSPLNTVVLVPFGDSPGKPVIIQSKIKAKQEILKFLNTPTKATEGTQIQPCYDLFFDLVREYNQPRAEDNAIQKKFKLKKLNMTLMTDGEAHFDQEKVKRDLKNLPEGMKVLFNLVLFGDKTNPELEKTVQSTNTDNSRSMVTVINSKMMDEFDNDSSHPKIKQDAFYLHRKMRSLGANLIQEISMLSIPAVNFNADISSARQQLMRAQSIKEIEVEDSATINLRQLQNITETLQGAAVPALVKRRFFNTLVQNYSRFMGRELKQISYLEESDLKELLAEVEK